MVSKNASGSSAGSTSTITRASTSAADHQVWGVPVGTVSVSPT